MAQISKDEVKRLIEQRPEGVQPQDVVSGLLARGHELEGYNEAAAPQEGSLVGDIGRALIKTPLRVGSSILAPAVDMARGFSQEEIAQRNVEGRDFGFLGKNIKPLGWQAADSSMGSGEKLGRGVADVSGGLAEMASYAYAPLRGAKGFFGMLGQAATSKGTAAYVGGEVLKDVGDGKSGGQVANEGMADYAATTVAAAVFGKAGMLFKNWGARLLGDNATLSAYNTINDEMVKLADISDGFPAKMSTIDESVRNSFVNQTNSAKRTFDKSFTALKDTMVERMQPTVIDRQKVFTRVSKVGREMMTNLFDDKNAKYATFGTADVPLNNFTSTKEVASGILGKITNVTDSIPADKKTVFDKMLKQGVNPEDAAKSLGVNIPAPQGGDLIQGIAAKIKEVVDNGLPNPGEVLRLNRQLLEAAKSADDESAQSLREIAFALFSDTGSMLRKAGREDLINLWDDAFKGHQKALDLVGSKLYRKLVSSGEFDTFFSNFTSGKLANEGEEKFFESIVREAPDDARQLIMDNIMNKVHKSSPEEGAALLENFLGNKGSKLFSFAKSVLNDEEMAFLYGMKDFLSYNFDDALLAAKVAQKPVTSAQQTLNDLIQMKGRLDVIEGMKKLGVDDFGEGVTDIFQKNPEAVGGIISNMTSQERDMVRLSMMRRMFNEKMVIGTVTPGGKYIDDAFIEMAGKTVADIEATSRRVGDTTIFGLFGKDQIQEMKKVSKMIGIYKDLRTVPDGDFSKIKAGIFAAFYGIRNWIPGTIANTQKAVAGVTDEEQLYYEAIEQIFNKIEGTKGTKIIRVGEVLNALTTRLNITPAVTTALEAGTTDFDNPEKP